MVPKLSPKLVDLLNQAIAREIQVSIQYMWQHIMATGLHSAAISDVFHGIAIEEMKHAEKIAERLFYFNEIPTTKPAPIEVGKGIKDMLKFDVKAEEEAIVMYKQIIKLANDDGDSTTRLLFEEILSDEEDHHDKFTTLLEE